MACDLWGWNYRKIQDKPRISEVKYSDDGRGDPGLCSIVVNMMTYDKQSRLLFSYG